MPHFHLLPWLSRCSTPTFECGCLKPVQPSSSFLRPGPQLLPGMTLCRGHCCASEQSQVRGLVRTGQWLLFLGRSNLMLLVAMVQGLCDSWHQAARGRAEVGASRNPVRSPREASVTKVPMVCPLGYGDVYPGAWRRVTLWPLEMRPGASGQPSWAAKGTPSHQGGQCPVTQRPTCFWERVLCGERVRPKRWRWEKGA